MKKLLLVVLLIIAAFVVYKYVFKKDDHKVKETPKALAVSAHSDTFNQSVKDILSAYYALTDGFVNWDTSSVNKNAVALQAAINNLKVDELKRDSIIYETVLFPLENTRNSVASILTADNWEGKRKSLQDLSENLRMLLITIKYDQEVVYWQECPMAFGEGTIGNWLSNNEKVINPYLGKKDPKYGATMINCGETKETINFVSADSTH